MQKETLYNWPVLSKIILWCDHLADFQTDKIHFKTDKLPALHIGVMPGMSVYLAVIILVLSRNRSKVLVIFIKKEKAGKPCL